MAHGRLFKIRGENHHFAKLGSNFRQGNQPGLKIPSSLLTKIRIVFLLIVIVAGDAGHDGSLSYNGKWSRYW